MTPLSGNKNMDALCSLIMKLLQPWKSAGISIPHTEEEETKWSGHDRKLEYGSWSILLKMTIKNCSGFQDLTYLVFHGNMDDKPKRQKYNWHSMLYVAVGKLLVTVPSVHGSVGEKMEKGWNWYLYFCLDWYLCLVTAAPPPGGEQGDARGRRCCRQLGPGTFPVKNKVKFFDPPKMLATCTFRVKNRSNFLTLPKCLQLCSEAEG